jgi:hypothetical protein
MILERDCWIGYGISTINLCESDISHHLFDFVGLENTTCENTCSLATQDTRSTLLEVHATWLRHEENTYNLQTKREGEGGRSQPATASNEISRGERLSLSCTCNHFVSFPCDPTGGPSTRPRILILCIKQCAQCKGATPLVPPGWLYHISYGWLHDDSPWILLPGPPKIRWETALNR